MARGMSYLIIGDAGTGKSTWIQTEARRQNASIFRWNARIDRSLREGRETLHTQVRSKERLFIWIEGADDLTQEAQAFLRRILETSSTNVSCYLEAREVWKLSSPILSRCVLRTMNQEQSYRQIQNQAAAKQFGLVSRPLSLDRLTYTALLRLRQEGADPYEILAWIEARDGFDDVAYQEMLRAISSGKSIWVQLAKKCV